MMPTFALSVSQLHDASSERLVSYPNKALLVILLFGFVVSNTCDIATLGPWDLDLPPGPATKELRDSGQMTQLLSDSGSHL